MMAVQPFYVSPEQLMADRADFARKGIARGRSVLVAQYDGGIAFVTENPSRALHKFSEIYDRIGFAAVGKYNEFESLRVAGIRYADMRGYTYDRSDVTARGLANAYAQTLGTAFTNESKPFEVELVVAEVGDSEEEDLLYRLTFDGSVVELPGYIVIGGNAAVLREAMEENWRPHMSLAEVFQLMTEVLAQESHLSAPTQQPDAAGTPTDSSAIKPETKRLTGVDLEAAVLDRARPRRKFRRLTPSSINQLLGVNT